MLKLALLGNPVSHSISPNIHTQFLAEANILGEYTAIAVENQDLQATLLNLQKAGYTGLNVTIPHKSSIMAYLDSISKEAQLIGAVNTIIFQDKQIIGDNTDYLGFIQSINTSVLANIKTANIIGAGGSARAIIVGLIKYAKQLKQINILVKQQESSLEKAESLKYHFADYCQTNNICINIITDSQELINGDILVNTSPVGMQPNVDMSPVSEDIFIKLAKHCYVYDLIYNPKQTLFLQYANKYQLDHQNGLSMLIEQARQSFYLWTGFLPKKDIII